MKITLKAEKVILETAERTMVEAAIRIATLKLVTQEMEEKIMVETATIEIAIQETEEKIMEELAIWMVTLEMAEKIMVEMARPEIPPLDIVKQEKVILVRVILLRPILRKHTL